MFQGLQQFKSRKYHISINDKDLYRRGKLLFFYILTFKYKLFGNASVLNVEEMATIFHFPNKNVTTPGIAWLGARRSFAPSHIPSEGVIFRN